MDGNRSPETNLKPDLHTLYTSITTNATRSRYTLKIIQTIFYGLIGFLEALTITFTSNTLVFIENTTGQRGNTNYIF